MEGKGQWEFPIFVGSWIGEYGNMVWGLIAFGDRNELTRYLEVFLLRSIVEIGVEIFLFDLSDTFVGRFVHHNCRVES